MKSTYIGLIGCGARMNSLLDKIPGFGENIFVNSIYDPDQNAALKMKNRLGDNVIVCDRYIDVINDKKTEWIFIASWNCYHKEHIIQASLAKKNIFCEKPLATSFEDCLLIDKHIKGSKVKFILGFTLRYSPHYRFIRDFIQEGSIGDIISMEFNETLKFSHGGYIMSNWRRLQQNAGTHLLEKCCHDLDIAYWITKSLPKRVASFGGLNFYIPKNSSRIDEIGPDKNGFPAYRTWRGTITPNPFTSDKDIVDNQVAIIEYRNGIRATFHTNCNSAIPERRLYILGSKGTIRADIMAGRLEYCPIGFEAKIQDLSTGFTGGHGGGDKILGEEIAEIMRNDESPKTGIRDGLIAAITAFGIDRSMETGQIIDLSRDWIKAGIIG